MNSLKYLKANWEEVPDRLLEEQRGGPLGVNKAVAVKRALDYIEALESFKEWAISEIQGWQGERGLGDSKEEIIKEFERSRK